MISDEEKSKIKAEIVEKVNDVLEKNNESFRMDQVNVLNKRILLNSWEITGFMTEKITMPYLERLTHS